jgi:uncharacterized protein YdeI (YjbR/CyaY-like superfamily)
MKPVHFATAADFRAWLESHHAAAKELLVAFHKKDSGRGGLTYPEALDEALCFGWIDGVRRRLDDERYTIRFTPRKPGSIWSNINVRHAERLIACKRMQPAGRAAFAARDAKKTGIYSFENRVKKLPPAFEQQFRANPKAWTFFRSQAPSYQRTAIFVTLQPKQAATRQRWLERLIADSAAGRRLARLTPSRR